ncbi:MAG: hypothetical protein KFH87_01195 [Bacteroidetes bacterium]|nr:hypothetical protein [Bacteroidota bacterium]
MMDQELGIIHDFYSTVGFAVMRWWRCIPGELVDSPSFNKSMGDIRKKQLFRQNKKLKIYLPLLYGNRSIQSRPRLLRGVDCIAVARIGMFKGWV